VSHLGDAWMRRAVQQARRAGHRTSPNPKVGCVIVADGIVVGTGVTQPVGGHHAEVVALARAGERARGADLYVTLEPCCHHGRTPPCTEAIRAAGIRRVFVGVADPNPLIAGGGLRRLAELGLHVEVGVLGDVCAALHAPFFRYITEKRPWVVLKAAVTLDGRMATPEGSSRWITGPEARKDAHRLRAWADAVLVGGTTARLDDPALDVRHVRGPNPLRVVADTELSLPPTARLLGPGALVMHAADADPGRAAALAATGAQLQIIKRSGRGLDSLAILRNLAERQVVSVLVEGGGRLHGSLLHAGLVDEACIYVAPRIIGPGRALADLPAVASVAQGFALEDPVWTPLGQDMRVRGRVHSGAVAEPEAAQEEGAPCSPD